MFHLSVQIGKVIFELVSKVNNSGKGGLISESLFNSKLSLANHYPKCHSHKEKYAQDSNLPQFLEMKPKGKTF
jgi:hypothetical protein